MKRRLSSGFGLRPGPGTCSRASWRRRAGALLAIGALWYVPLSAGAENTSAASEAALPSVAIAPFRAIAASDRDVPDVASLLADRLAARGGARVVGPSALGVEVPEDGAPSADDVRAWAARASVGALVAGKTRRTGGALELETRLHDASTGGELGVWRNEVAKPEDLAPALDRLAGDVMASLPRPKTAGGTAGGARKNRLSAEGFDSKAPISIHSSELEAFETDQGGRRFVFTDKVEVVQGNVTLHSDRLEAFYPPNASQPERLVATGHVVVAQAGKRARCREATYLNAQQRVYCRGDAQLEQGADRAEGREIELQLDTQRMFIRGGAQIRITPRDDSVPAPRASRP